jgi:hypothetical protein
VPTCDWTKNGGQVSASVHGTVSRRGFATFGFKGLAEVCGGVPKTHSEEGLHGHGMNAVPLFDGLPSPYS